MATQRAQDTDTPRRRARRDGFELPASHGFLRVAAALPALTLADPLANAVAIARLAEQAAGQGVALVAFPELALTGYTCDDLFHQGALQGAVTEGLALLLEQTAALPTVVVVGTPLPAGDGLFNTALLLFRGRPLCAFPKSYLPSYHEFYERRYFRAAREALSGTVPVGGQDVPFGSDLVVAVEGEHPFSLHVELCEDLWVAVPPSTYAALGGATVLVNISASSASIAKADYRRLLAASHSGRCVAALLYVSAGPGESTTDLAFDGHALICENGEVLAEQRWGRGESLLLCDLDLERLGADRLRLTSFGECAADLRARSAALRRVVVTRTAPPTAPPLRREVARYPFVPARREQLDERCEEVFAIQVAGLAGRLRATGIEKVVIGLSGGLDSAHALLVCVEALAALGLPRKNVLAYTMPGFATSARTIRNAKALMEGLGVSGTELDIRPAAKRMLADLGHPAAEGKPHYDATFENVQAGERTSYLFRLANLNRALMVGTSDLSELALGWCTYGVGDQMSHYAVNASVPKTLVQFLLAWNADRSRYGETVSKALEQVLATAISPELVPAGEGEEPTPDSEAVVGPYDLVDFFLYYVLRFGYRPSKVAFLAEQAWSDVKRGAWPELIPPARRRAYTRAEIKRWLAVFLERFFGFAQFKRSALPNGPKVGTGGALSPRGDWRAPSDSSPAAWLKELEENVP